MCALRSQAHFQFPLTLGRPFAAEVFSLGFRGLSGTQEANMNTHTYTRQERRKRDEGFYFLKVFEVVQAQNKQSSVAYRSYTEKRALCTRIHFSQVPGRFTHQLFH